MPDRGGSDEIEIVELDARFDMAMDPLGLLMDEQGNCGGQCGNGCTNTGGCGGGCGVSCK
jgi:hypothetical protein